MIRQLWAKIGRRKGKSGIYADPDNPERAVVPLRNRKSTDPVVGPEAALVTKKDHIDRFTEGVNKLVGKLDGIHTHLGSQASQNEQLLKQMNQQKTLYTYQYVAENLYGRICLIRHPHTTLPK